MGWLGSGLGQQHRCTCTPTWCHHRRISPCGSTTTSCYVNIIWYHMPLLLLRQKNFFCTAGCFKLYRHFTWCYVRRPSLALPPQLEAAFFLIWPNSMHFHPTPLSPNSMHFQQPQRLTRIGTPKREKGPKGCNAVLSKTTCMGDSCREFGRVADVKSSSKDITKTHQKNENSKIGNFIKDLQKRLASYGRGTMFLVKTGRGVPCQTGLMHTNLTDLIWGFWTIISYIFDFCDVHQQSIVPDCVSKLLPQS